MKTLDITDAKGAMDNIGDLKRWGDPNTWKLIAKASSDEQGWMKSTKAMEVPGIGVVIQVTTQQANGYLVMDDEFNGYNYSVAEALTFVPFATIVEDYDETGTLVGRHIAMRETRDDGYYIQESV